MDSHTDPKLQCRPCSIQAFLKPSSALQILEQVLSPVPSSISSFRDTVLVVLDTETVTCSTRIRELGIAMLDTRQLARLSADDKLNQEAALRTLIQTRMFLLGKSKRSPRAQKFWPIRFLFGETEEIPDASEEERDAYIRDVLTSTLVSTSRSLILVGHSIENDCYNIKLNYGIDITHLPTVTAIIDTARIASSANNFVARKMSLYDTCLSCGVTPEQLHNAGNDAVYTLRTTLLLFKRYQEEELFQATLSNTKDHDNQTTLLWGKRLEQLNGIGRAHETIVVGHLKRAMDEARERRRAKRRGRKAVEMCVV